MSIDVACFGAVLKKSRLSLLFFCLLRARYLEVLNIVKNIKYFRTYPITKISVRN